VGLSLNTLSEIGEVKSDFILLPSPEPSEIPVISQVIDVKKAKEKGAAKRFSLNNEAHPVIRVDGEEGWSQLIDLSPSLILLAPKAPGRVQFCRRFYEWLLDHLPKTPVILNFEYTNTWDDAVIQAGAECGALLSDGIGEGVLLEGPFAAESLCQLGFSILQGCRMRSVKTEFISCPSCGRTLFNLQEVSARIRQRTSHLPGVKIAIMGCIVNGPGEMADADFGYVGSKTDKVDLYVGKTCVEKNIDHAEADDRLIELIKSYGKWVDPCTAISN